MKHLSVLNTYFWKYRKHFFAGIICIVLSNYFRILSPRVAGFVVDLVQQKLATTSTTHQKHTHDVVTSFLKSFANHKQLSTSQTVLICSITLLLLAIISGVFMFLMRQTIIVMSRHIEYEQKNAIFKKYQILNLSFYKTNRTGDLMNRISEDVGKVRMYTGPAIMYFFNLAATIGFSVFFMVRENWQLTIYVLAPLPLLAFTIYKVNSIINKKGEKIQQLLSEITITAQETYSGIRVIKSFVQEKSTQLFFNKTSEAYKKNSVGLAAVEALYFPSMALMIGISTLLTIGIGCWYMINNENNVSVGTITEFVIYINLLTFPVSAIGWTASLTQRAAVSQKRINEFLEIEPSIVENPNGISNITANDISFNNISFTYSNTGITALKNFSLSIKKGEKVLIMGKTGSGKTTVAQLLLRFYDAETGEIKIDTHHLKDLSLRHLREQISYVPQDVFLFSDTIAHNICFGLNEEASLDEIKNAAKMAAVEKDIDGFEKQYETVIGERGVTLSGGQKQRISIARALLKKPEILIFDDCLSAVDAKTEQEIIGNLYQFLNDKTAIIITHKIFAGFSFDKIVVLEEGKIIELGKHDELLQQNGYYAEIFRKQMEGRRE